MLWTAGIETFQFQQGLLDFSNGFHPQIAKNRAVVTVTEVLHHLPSIIIYSYFVINPLTLYICVVELVVCVSECMFHWMCVYMNALSLIYQTVA